MRQNPTYPEELQRAAHWFGKLPGIGHRTAERLALALMGWREEDVAAFGAELSVLRQKVGYCPECGNYSPRGTLCAICADGTRDDTLLCVVEKVPQIAVIEKAGCFRGRYHVLGGKIAPLNGIGPQDLRIAELRRRVRNGGFREILLALSADVEGEATAQYLAQEFASGNLAITRIAAGIPVGADLAFADSATLAAAINSRRPL